MTTWLITYGGGDFDDGVSYETNDAGLSGLIERTITNPGFMVDGTDFLIIRKANYLNTTVANPNRTRLTVVPPA